MKKRTPARISLQPGYPTLHRRKGAGTAFAVLTALVLCAFSSCTKKSVWHTDLAAAEGKAAEENKHIFAFFSGDDWDGRSLSFRKSVIDSETFASEIDPQYILLNIDSSQTDDAKAVTATESGAQDAETKRFLEKYKNKQALLQTYNVQEYPAVYLLSKEGYVLAALTIDDSLADEGSFFAALHSLSSETGRFGSLIAAVSERSGVAKARAIDELYEATDVRFQQPLFPLVREFITLDGQNETGLVGKYEVIAADREVLEMLPSVRAEDAIKPYLSVCENGHLDNAQKQNLYYTAAYTLSVLGSSDFIRMHDLLSKSYMAMPDSEHAADIKMMMEKTLAMHTIVATASEDNGAE